MTGTDLQIIKPKCSEIAGADAERLPTLHTTGDQLRVFPRRGTMAAYECPS